MKLYRDYGILARNLVELGALACAADPRFKAAYNRPIVSLAKVTAWYMHRTLDKGPVRTSDWERPLSREQIQCKWPFVTVVCLFLMETCRCSERRPLRRHDIQAYHDHRAIRVDLVGSLNIFV